LLGQSLHLFPRKTSATFCLPWSLLRKALIRAGKTPQTAGTLYAIQSKSFKNIRKQYMGNKEEIRRKNHIACITLCLVCIVSCSKYKPVVPNQLKYRVLLYIKMILKNMTPFVPISLS
jgi:hypothetical protein